MYQSAIKQIITANTRNDNVTVAQYPQPVVQAGCFATILQHIPRPLHTLKPVVICDENTFEAAADAMAMQLSHAKVLRFSTPLVASIHQANQIASRLNDYDYTIAVGSGSINDITKHACALARKPLITCATAASMNGYGARNASLYDMDKVKASVAGVMPEAILFDLSVIAQSPEIMTLAGLADTLCFTSLRADMLLQQHILNAETPLDLLAPHATFLNWLQNDAEKNPDPLLEHLCNALVYGGYCMSSTDSSAIASQGEHMLAHWCEQRDTRPRAERPLHGEQIAVTTCIMLRLQHYMLEQPVLEYDIGSYEATCTDYEHQHLRGPHLAKEYDAKRAVLHACIAQRPLTHCWTSLREALLRQHYRYADIETLYQQLGLPTRPEHIGWTMEMIAEALQSVHLSRNRFTFLDLAHLTGMMEGFVEQY